MIILLYRRTLLFIIHTLIDFIKIKQFIISHIIIYAHQSITSLFNPLLVLILSVFFLSQDRLIMELSSIQCYFFLLYFIFWKKFVLTLTLTISSFIFVCHCIILIGACTHHKDLYHWHTVPLHIVDYASQVSVA